MQLHCSLSKVYGNTAQFPPDGLSTTAAAAALRIMWHCPRHEFLITVSFACFGKKTKAFRLYMEMLTMLKRKIVKKIERRIDKS